MENSPENVARAGDTAAEGESDDLLLWQPQEAETRVIALLDPYLNFERTDELKPRLAALIERETANGARRFILDLAKTGVIDSCGLAVLVSLERQIDESGGRLVLCGLSDLLLRLFELTRLERVFTILPDVDQALAARSEP